MDKLKQTLASILVLGALALFAVSPHPAQAQEEPGEAFIGLQGGLAQSSITGNGTSADSYQGYTFGASFTYNFNSVFSAELDLRYTRKGADNVQATSGPSVSDALDYTGDNLRLTYLEAPILFKLTAPIEAVRIRGFAGPSFNNALAAKQNGQETLTRIQSDLPVEERMLFYDVGGIVGGEIALPLPSIVDEIALDGRYYFGFKQLDEFQGFDLKNRSFSGTVSVRFAL